MDKALVRLTPPRIAPKSLEPGSQAAAPQAAAPQAAAEWQPAPEPELLEDGAPKQVLRAASPELMR